MLEKPNKLRSALLGGLIISVISGIPGLNLLNCCCCAGILFGGMMGVYFYKKEFTDAMPPMQSSDAVLLGVISGIIGAVVTTILTTIITLILGPIELEMIRGFMENMVQKFEEQGSVPPGTLDNMQTQFEASIKEAGSIAGILRSLVYALILYPIFGMLGGLIGYGIFGRKKQAMPPQVNPM